MLSILGEAICLGLLSSGNGVAVFVDVIVEDRTSDVVREPLPVDLNHAIALAVLIRRGGDSLRTFQHRVVAEAIQDLDGEYLGEAGVGMLRTELRISGDGASGAIAEFHDQAIASPIKEPPLALMAAGAVLVISKPAA